MHIWGHVAYGVINVLITTACAQGIIFLLTE